MSRPSLGQRVLTFLAALAALTALFFHLQAGATAQQEALRRRVLERLGGRPVVFLGDSHIECAVDDRETTRLVNFATSSEHYVFTLQKLRRLHPRVVVLGTWIHNFLPYYGKLLGPVLLNRLDIWDATMTPEERRDVQARLDFEAASFLRLRSLLPFAGTQLEHELAQKRRGFGGFHDGRGGDGVGIDATERRLSEMLEEVGDYPTPFQVRYLSKIVDHCRRRAVPLVLLSTPVHPRLRAALPAGLERGFRELVAAHVGGDGVRHWDYSTLALDDDLYRDPDHLTVVGARLFTGELLDRLERERLPAGSSRRASPQPVDGRQGPR